LGIMENIPLMKMLPIFAVTFLMILVVFIFIEPSMYCEETDSYIPECALVHGGEGNFIMGVLIAGALFLLDMLLLYMTLGELLLPGLATDQE